MFVGIFIIYLYCKNLAKLPLGIIFRQGSFLGLSPWQLMLDIGWDRTLDASCFVHPVQVFQGCAFSSVAKFSTFLASRPSLFKITFGTPLPP